ncbi:hypothetical protein MJH12_01885 [bacterium]|nr:hypothetical protein [bacterium]
MNSKKLSAIIGKALEIKEDRKATLECRDLLEIAKELDIEENDLKLACQMVSSPAESLEIKQDIKLVTQAYIENSLLHEFVFY